MTGPQYAGLRAIYGRPSADRIAELIEAADALAAALQTLRTNPTRDGADRIANQLHGMHRSAGQLVAVLAQEVAA
jgi:hypothetical protein